MSFNLRAFAFLPAFMLSACHPKIDSTSSAKLVASVATVRLALDADKREKFDDALLSVAFKNIHDRDLLDLARHADDIVPEARKALHGKTATQIMAQAQGSRK